jgi:hypothetical protein
LQNPVAKNCTTVLARQDRRHAPVKTLTGTRLKVCAGIAGVRLSAQDGPLTHQHFGGQNGLPSKQKPSVGVIFPLVAQTCTLHHFAALHAPVQRAPAMQAGFAAAFFFAAKAGCGAARVSAAMARVSETIAINLVMDQLPSDRSADPVP